MEVIAWDGKGNVFPKTVTTRIGDHGKIISFGFPCEYYTSTLQYNQPKEGDNLCIDAEGRNHKGHPVYITWTKSLLELLNSN